MPSNLDDLKSHLSPEVGNLRQKSDTVKSVVLAVLRNRQKGVPIRYTIKSTVLVVLLLQKSAKATHGTLKRGEHIASIQRRTAGDMVRTILLQGLDGIP